MNVKQLRAQIVSLQDATMDENKNFRTAYDEGKFDALSVVDTMLDSMQEEPVIKGLEEAAVEAFKQIVDSDKNSFLEIFKAGAKWKEEQIMKDAVDTELDDVCGFLTVSIPYHNGIAGDKVKVIIIKSE